MTTLQRHLSRRQFLANSAAAAGALALDRFGFAAEPPPPSGDAHFFIVSDTHYLADKADPAKLDARSAGVTRALIETLNRLPGTTIPDAAGGGTVGTPLGVIHGGDLIDTGDKAGVNFAAMQRTEWDAYVRDFGLTGKDGLLKYPVYEVHGNHDAPSGKGITIDGIIARNKSRPGVTNVSANGLHYSWDWGPLHFVCLGIVVGQVKAVARKRRYDPLQSLDFLIDDLKAKVGDSGRPVVLVHHVDVARYTRPCNDEPVSGNPEWDPCDVRAFHEALRPYNIAAVFYGHTHARNVFKWDGASAKAAAGVNVFNVDNSSHFNSDTQSLYYVRANTERLTLREYATKDRWATAEWTPQVWELPLAVRQA